jgi:hypothetical protein
MPANYTKSILWADVDEPCDHQGDTVIRVAHGYLADAPVGTVETLCADCGVCLKSEAPR